MCLDWITFVFSNSTCPGKKVSCYVVVLDCELGACAEAASEQGSPNDNESRISISVKTFRDWKQIKNIVGRNLLFVEKYLTQN